MKREVIELKLVPEEADETFEELKERFITGDANCYEMIPVPSPYQDEGFRLVPIFNQSEAERYRDILSRCEEHLIKIKEEGVPKSSLNQLPLIEVDGLVYEPELLYESWVTLEKSGEE
ncbi:hypothetical protein K9M78_08465 [Candidatus Bipolaricaulota bacterium]|nr:hypothetical protein [Candidatus Bipolaricaulota bacterium]